MPVTITIRSVPDDVRNALAARAKRQGKSLQEYLQGELRNLADKPTVEEWFDRARRHAAQRSRLDLTGEEIGELIQEDRAEREALLLERVEGEWSK
ncbi:hypothetical protein GCM10028798_05450 [Humibacter antri]